MTDLSRILPDFPIGQYGNLIPGLEKHQVTTSDLLTLEVTDLGKRTQLSLMDLTRLRHAVLEALHVDLGVSEKQKQAQPTTGKGSSALSSLRQDGTALLARPWSTISTLDPSLDDALGGGIPTGYVTEMVGESGAGKTQFLLTLLLSVQLPPPHGLGRKALYISTEAPLSTIRLSQMLHNNPFFQSLDDGAPKPSLNGVIGTITPDLESQDHILQFQVPVEVERRNIGLLVLDSVAANYRAEFERGPGVGGGSNLAARSAELLRLGQLLHELARKHNLAVVVANQVADRFGPKETTPYPIRLPVSQDSPLASRSRAPKGPLPGAEPTSSAAHLVRSSMPEPPPEEAPAPPALLLDHQQRWFTGWGDDPYADYPLKTPSLGLTWSTQIACRIALFKRPVYGRNEVLDDEDESGSVTMLKTWRRHMKVVFAPHVPPSGQGLNGAVEFEVTMGGLKSVEKKQK